MRETTYGKKGGTILVPPSALPSPRRTLPFPLSRALPRVWTLYRRLESDSWRLDFLLLLLLLLLLRPFGFFLETVGENTGVCSLDGIQGVSIVTLTADSVNSASISRVVSCIHIFVSCNKIKF